MQRRLLAARQAGECPDVLLLLEHPPVYTCGRRAGPDQLRVPASLLPAPLYEADRGGGITFHGPGQLVAYLVMDLRAWRTDVQSYLRALEEVALRTLARYGLQGERIQGLTGVWLRGEKVASIGVKLSRWCTMHGLALNVATDPGWFQPIVPCGIADRSITSMHLHLRHVPPLEEVARALAEECAGVFSRDLDYRQAAGPSALLGPLAQVLAQEGRHAGGSRPQA